MRPPALKIVTRGAFDCQKVGPDKAQRKDRENKARRRAEAGARPHAQSLSGIKPWDSAGMSGSNGADRGRFIEALVIEVDLPK